jgi:hypothetical protein
MAGRADEEKADAAHRRLLDATHSKIGEAFDRQAKRVKALEEQLARERARLGDLSTLLLPFEDMSSGGSGKEDAPESPPERSRTAHSSRGRLGMRDVILEVMSTSPDETWSPTELHPPLLARGITTTLRNVQNTMRRMAADDQLAKDGRGLYRLPS